MKYWEEFMWWKASIRATIIRRITQWVLDSVDGIIYSHVTGIFTMHVHDDTWDRKKERKNERKTPEAMKNENELPQVGFEPTTLCTPDRCSYMYNYSFLLLHI